MQFPSVTTTLSFSRTALLTALATIIGLSGCVGPTGPMRRDVTYEPPRIPDTQVIFYPTAGQSPEQQSRDRYECYQWASRQTGFDPSQLSLAPRQRVEVTPAVAPGHDTAAGAITGAVIGAILGGPHSSGAGAAFGAITGAAAGAISDSERQRQADQIQRHYDAREGQHQAAVDEQASNYRRAMTACIEGRGYSVSAR